MTLLSRYLLRSYLSPFLLALSVFLGVLLMHQFLRLFNLAVIKGISLLWIFSCFARLLPYFLSLALPMAFLVALLLTLGQLSDSGELMALRSAGCSFREILAPFLLLAALLSALLLYVNHKASPEGFHSFRQRYTQAASQVARLDILPRTFLNLGDWQFYADEANEDTGRLSGVRLVKRTGEYKRLRVSAPEGRAQLLRGQGVRLELFQGTLVWPNDDPVRNTASTFARYELFISFAPPAAAQREADLQELNTASLRARLANRALEPHKRREYLSEIALRSAGAAAPFVLFWVACPLGIRLERRSKAAAFALALAVIFSYYGLLVLGIGLGRRNLAVSSWAPWLPNVACLACGGWLWRRRLRC